MVVGGGVVVAVVVVVGVGVLVVVVVDVVVVVGAAAVVAWWRISTRGVGRSPPEFRAKAEAVPTRLTTSTTESPLAMR
jgi:hypothetical protein